MPTPIQAPPSREAQIRTLRSQQVLSPEDRDNLLRLIADETLARAEAERARPTTPASGGAR